DGNTPQAALSPAELVQVLTPGGPERLQGGRDTTITWNSSGVPLAGYVNEVLADHPAAYYRLDETTGTTAFDSSNHGLDGTYSATGAMLGVPGAFAGDAGVGLDGT